jgi:hypothetical protein
MSNSEYIKKHLQKHPFIMKSVLKMDDLNTINIKYIEHFVDIVKNHKSRFNKIQLAYNNYTKFIDLYKATLDVTGIEVVDIGFCNLSHSDKIFFLKESNIKYEISNDIILVYPSSFEEGQMIYPNKWCIKRSKTLWTSYNKNAEHTVLYRGDKVFGVSNSKTTFKCFTELDRNRSYSDFHNIIGKHLPSHLKIDRPKQTTIIKRNITKYMVEYICLIICMTITNITFMTSTSYALLEYKGQIVFYSTLITFLICLCLVIHIAVIDGRNRKILNLLFFCFPVFIAFSNIDTIKVRFANYISDEMRVEYNMSVLNHMRSENTYSASKMKDFLLGSTSVPYPLFHQVFDDVIKINDYDKFDFILTQFPFKKNALSRALIQAVALDNINFVNTIMNEYNVSDYDQHLESSVLIAIKNENKKIFKLLIDTGSIDDIEHSFLGSYREIFPKDIDINIDNRIFFYKYVLDNVKFHYDDLIKEAFNSEDTTLIKILLDDKYRQNEQHIENYLEMSLSIHNKIKRDKTVKLIFDKTVFDYHSYNNENIQLAILFNYDYIIDDFLLNIDKIKDIDYEDMLKLLSLTENDEALNKLKTYMDKR